MRELKLHSLGKNNHLKSLKEKYNLLRNKIIRNDRLTENEKNNELKSLSESFEKEKKDAKNNLY